MGKLIDLDARRSNKEMMDIGVRFEKREGNTKVRPLPHGRLWRPGDEPGDLGFQEGNEYD